MSKVTAPQQRPVETLKTRNAMFATPASEDQIASVLPSEDALTFSARVRTNQMLLVE